jgi:hypothetical protein
MIDWESLYERLINTHKNQILIEGEYYEKHHIIPRYLGGTNANDNLVSLPFRYHILAHFILYRWKSNLEDKIAYKMMGGQTEEGRILKQYLAIKRSNESNKIEKIKEMFSNKVIADGIIKKRKTTRYQNNGGNYYPESSLKILRDNMKDYDKFWNDVSNLKRSKTAKGNITQMSEEEFYERYVKNMEGPLHPMYGKKRPGELAGNYGKSKGQYILITPELEQIKFSGIKKLIQYGFSEIMVRKWSNQGIIQKDPKCYKPFKWEGYELKFIENLNYGEVNSKEKTKPNQKPNK